MHLVGLSHVFVSRCTVGSENIKFGAWTSGVPRGLNPPPHRNSEDIGGVLDRMSKKSRRLDFLLQFTVFSYGCNLLNKCFF